MIRLLIFFQDKPDSRAWVYVLQNNMVNPWVSLDYVAQHVNVILVLAHLTLYLSEAFYSNIVKVCWNNELLNHTFCFSYIQLILRYLFRSTLENKRGDPMLV